MGVQGKGKESRNLDKMASKNDPSTLKTENFSNKFQEQAMCAIVLYQMVAHFTLRKNDENQVSEKKIGFDNSFDVIKCLQQIEIPDLLHVCAR